MQERKRVEYEEPAVAPDVTLIPGERVGIKPLTPGQIFWRNFRRHRPAMAGVLVLSLIAILSIGAPVLVKSPVAVDLFQIYSRPSLEHPLGTDSIGRDYLARTVYGGRVSLRVGLFVALLIVVIGTTVGSISGYYRGKIDGVVMRFVDLMLALPLLPVLLVAGAIFGRTMLSMILVLSAFLWAPLARIVRGTFLSLREREFVVAAEAAGARARRIIFRHILPNAVGPIVVNATLNAGAAILLETTLSFLGFGIQPPTPTWGNLVAEAKNIMFTMPWLLLAPSFMIVLTVLCINFIGDGLRDALDPTQVHLKAVKA